MSCTVSIFKDTGLDQFHRWQDLPDSLFLHVFAFLPPKEVLTASRVCKKWYRNAKDELLWKGLFVEHFMNTNLLRRCPQLPSPLSGSWLLEFQRLYSETPAVESQVLDEHQDEVLHVAFSNNGRLFASSSKDCQAIVWDISTGEARVKLKFDFREHRWEYVQFCEFSRDDSLLLVSGINERRRLNFMGEIIICAIDGDGDEDEHIVQNVISEPYDVFGAWLTEAHYISGSFEFRVPFYDSSISELWANSKYGGTPVRLCRVMNENGSSVRNVLVGKPGFLKEDEFYLIFTHGIVTYIPHQIVVKKITLRQSAMNNLSVLPDNDEASNLKQNTGGNDSDGEDEDDGFTRLDHVIETHAHIIGVGLSPDENMLYVNCRPWVNRGKDEVTTPRTHLNGHEDLEISDSIHTRVYSLSTMKFVKEHVGHKAFTPNDKCFFIFLDVADLLLASGAEDECAHVWDRHFGFKVATLEGHQDVVNCVAFNPRDPEILVSASDDHTLRIWKSRRKAAH